MREVIGMFMIILIFTGLLGFGIWIFDSVIGGAALMAVAGLSWFVWVLNRAMQSEDRVVAPTPVEASKPRPTRAQGR
ncbi:hypothetical protein F0M18_06810 [Pseudohalioglobus sediminis]|uniref:Uncharacterized protein n=1 Tax=Pseudohalioglobus sediminis TaxID=2606449 RepID=A0A5B0WZ94_9GAMM|nr:hypothetical protein [Pseudohalioglobus sediminis]KAA1192382.1 hypothetical protein F0M18_06810 [Pseudohalioglobus sediminis]